MKHKEQIQDTDTSQIQESHRMKETRNIEIGLQNRDNLIHHRLVWLFARKNVIAALKIKQTN